MNVSVEWLRAFVPFEHTPAALRELITTHVTTVDDVVPLRTDLAPFVVARVVHEAAHPDSDHLHVTRVDAGAGELLDVVCGAPNVKAGGVYPFAPVGTTMPNGLKIEKRRIRGAISAGMLCSPSELGLGAESGGLLELTTDAPVGTPLLRVLPIGDSRLEIDVGANRPDLLSHLGIAREIAAVSGLPLSLPALSGVAIPAGAGATLALDESRLEKRIAGGAVTVRLDDPSLVRRFMGVVIRGVTVGPSPDWLRERIESVGGRSINNVVDASNYVLHELGQPTHAFDLAKLAGSSVVVRLAMAGERITTLDGQARALTDATIVIADAERPQAVAGIMGGRDSEVTESTRDIFLEVANFDAARIRAARRALGLATDASYRFERGVDVEIAPVALTRVAAIIPSLAGGRIDGDPADFRTGNSEQPEVRLRVDRVTRVLGDPVPKGETVSLLTRLGFDVKDSPEGSLSVRVPSWRGDVRAEVDLIEEIARLRGYHAFSNELRPFRVGSVPDDPRWMLARRLRRQLSGAGFLETRAMPFVPGGEGFVRVENPLAENEAYLRREVLDSLARRAEHNLARMQGDLRLFEVGAVFRPSTGPLPEEEQCVAALMMGRRVPPHFTDLKSHDADAAATFGPWDAKALAESIAATAYPGQSLEFVGGVAATSAQDAQAVALPSAAIVWAIRVDGHVRGRVGRVRLDAPVWASPAWGIELSLGLVDSAPVAAPGRRAERAPTRPRPSGTQFIPLPTTPASTVDLALLVPDSIAASEVEAVIRRSAGDVLEQLSVFDVYAGIGVAPGHRSIAWRLTFRHPERTLRDKEIDARRDKVLSALQSELNVRPRTS